MFVLMTGVLGVDDCFKVVEELKLIVGKSDKIRLHGIPGFPREPGRYPVRPVHVPDKKGDGEQVHQEVHGLDMGIGIDRSEQDGALVVNGNNRAVMMVDDEITLDDARNGLRRGRGLDG